MVRNFGSAIMAAALTLSSAAYAQTDAQQPVPQQAPASDQGPLVPGAAAGMQQAQGFDVGTTGLIIGAGALAAAGLCLAICNSGHGASTTTTTTTTTN